MKDIPPTKQTIKTNKTINQADLYGEISEPRTSKFGYFLLALLAFYIAFACQGLFDSIRGLPKHDLAVQPSHCIENYVTNFNDSGYPCYGKHVFNAVDKKFGLDRQYLQVEPILKEIVTLTKRMSVYEVNFRETDDNIVSLEAADAKSLQQDKVNITAISQKADILARLAKARFQITLLHNKIEILTKRKNVLVLQSQGLVKILQQDYDKAYKFYRKNHVSYEFKVFLLSLLFILPVFLASGYCYRRLKRKNSPYAIIFATLAIVFGLLVLQIISVFLYNTFLGMMIEVLLKYLHTVPIIRLLFYYAYMIFIFLVLGGAVYFIQKRIFDPAKVAIRRLKNKTCPRCSFVVEPENSFCSECGLHIQVSCSHCHKLKIKYLPYCRHCGQQEQQ